MFEGADPAVFEWYIQNYGNEVNLFVDHSQIVQLEALRSGIPALIAQLETALADREAGRAPEPELTRPRPDGPLAGLQPLVIVG